MCRNNNQIVKTSVSTRSNRIGKRSKLMFGGRSTVLNKNQILDLRSMGSCAMQTFAVCARQQYLVRVTTPEERSPQDLIFSVQLRCGSRIQYLTFSISTVRKVWATCGRFRCQNWTLEVHYLNPHERVSKISVGIARKINKTRKRLSSMLELVCFALDESLNALLKVP